MVLRRSLAALVACALVWGGVACGDTSRSSRDHPAEEPPPAAPNDEIDPQVAEVPDTTGEPADEAQSTIEDEGFSVTFDPEEPGDPSSCTVDDQDLVGDAEPESEITLTISCEVPDVTDMDGQEAIDTLEQDGFTWYLDDCDDDPSACIVTDQDMTEADPGAEISLTMERGGGGGGGGDGSADCHPSYEGECLDPSAEDYDCPEGTGDGPEYTQGEVQVVGPDDYGLDADGDGIGCVGQ